MQKADALIFLESHPLGVLATVGAENTPELSSLYFFCKGDFDLYFVTKTGTRKYRNFLAKQAATLLSYDEEELTSVEVCGEVETVTDLVKAVQIIEMFQGLVLLRKAGYWVPPIAQLEKGDYVVCRLVPNTVRFNKFSSPETKEAPELLVFHPGQ